jgi:hypothetical protein
MRVIIAVPSVRRVLAVCAARFDRSDRLGIDTAIGSENDVGALTMISRSIPESMQWEDDA